MADLNNRNSSPSMTMTPARKPWALFASVYVTQYLGLAFIFAASVAIMRDMGIALSKLALINLIALPILLKIFYAPFIDNIRLSVMGKRLQGQYRSWLIIAQFLMVVLLIVISTMNITSQFGLVIGLMLIYSFAVSIQDVAIDGLACKLFAKDERQRVNSVQFSGNLIGNVIGGGLILMAYPWLGWQGSLWLLALLTTIAWLQLISFIEPKTPLTLESELTANDTSKLQPTLLQTLKQLTCEIAHFIKRHGAWFGLLLIYPIGFSSGFALVNPLLVDANWALADIGFVTKIFGSLIGIVSAISASVLVTKLGRMTALFFLTIAQAVVLLWFLPLGFGHTSKLMVYSAIGAYFLVNPALMATIATIIMDKASSQSAKATFFTLQLGTVAFMGFVYAGLAMTAANYMGYSNALIGAAVLTFIIVIVVRSNRDALALL